MTQKNHNGEDTPAQGPVRGAELTDGDLSHVAGGVVAQYNPKELGVESNSLKTEWITSLKLDQVDAKK